MIDLKEIITKYPECLESAAKLKSYLADLYPEEKARCSILATIFDVGIAEQINNGKVDNLSVDSYCNSLEDTYGYSPRLIRECVEIWIVAYGIESEDVSVQRAPTTPLSDFVIKDGVLVKYIGTNTDVVIPACVTTIGKDSFRDYQALESVVIPDGVTTIENAAFICCSSLKSAVIPDSVTKIDIFSFGACLSLTIKCNHGSYAVQYARDYGIAIEFPDFAEYEVEKGILIKYAGIGGKIIVPSCVTVIGKHAFYRCRTLEGIEIPGSVTKIESEAFLSCSSLRTVILPNSVEKIGKNAFEYCRSLEDIRIPDSVTKIDAGTFSGCEALKNIVIPNSVEKIFKSAFNECKSLTIKCSHDSCAEQYAKENDIPVEYLD